MIPSREQQQILDLGLDTIRVRAGAGTGKTTTVAMAIANLIERHEVAPEAIMGLTFTNKAAAELAQRVSELRPETVDPARQVEVHTYHGFAAQVLSEFGPLAGLDRRAGIITPTFSRQLIQDIYQSRPPGPTNMTYRGTVDRIRRLNDQMGDHLLLPQEVIRAGPVGEIDSPWAERFEMAEVLADYYTSKTTLGVVDYSDLVTMSTRILNEHPGLVSLVRDRYQVLILDEYQDTNPAQRTFLTTIFGDGFPVIAVGDEDQTIYEWRGASAENFERFDEHFKRPNGEPPHLMSLTENRRSGDEILTVANLVRRRANPGADELVSLDEAESEVITHFAPDAVAEAEWIARSFETLHSHGSAWRDMAVLIRKNKDFSMIIDALTSHGIPIEVANVGGLLSIPEVSQLRAWLTILTFPEDSAALTEVLTGTKFRVGIADLAAVTRAMTRPRHEDSEEPDTLSLLEAIESDLGSQEVSDEGARRLNHFRSLFSMLLEQSQGLSLVETCRLVLDRTRAWSDVEAMPDNARLSARLNIYRFLDVAEDWSPLSGRPSTSAFLDYLTTMEDEPAEELDSARLSGEDAVTLVTVHRAKGLEWPTVAIPGVVAGNFPSGSGRYPDPLRFGEFLPHELRLDQTLATLPEDDASRMAFFRQRNDLSEWRVAYVAVTRAKERLLVSGAYWYGLPEVRKTPAKPSELFELVRSAGAVRDEGHAPLGPRPTTLRRPTPSPPPDPVFDKGWAETLSVAAADDDYPKVIAARLGIGEEVAAQVEKWTDRLFALDSIPEIESPPERTVSVTGLVTYAMCPLRFYWSEIDPLPRHPSRAAAIGTEIHRQIELHQKGQASLHEVSETSYDVPDTQGTPIGDGGFAAYENSRFAEVKAGLVEVPFELPISNGYRVRGRIDAIYCDDDHWEIVDFKSGRQRPGRHQRVQLEAYAVAASDLDFGLPRPEVIDVTFAYLGGGLSEITERADTAWTEQARNNLNRITTAIDSTDFDPTPGRWCENCDFLRFCEAGRTEVKS